MREWFNFLERRVADDARTLVFDVFTLGSSTFEAMVGEYYLPSPADADDWLDDDEVDDDEYDEPVDGDTGSRFV